MDHDPIEDKHPILPRRRETGGIDVADRRQVFFQSGKLRERQFRQLSVRGCSTGSSKEWQAEKHYRAKKTAKAMQALMGARKGCK